MKKFAFLGFAIVLQAVLAYTFLVHADWLLKLVGDNTAVLAIAMWVSAGICWLAIDSALKNAEVKPILAIFQVLVATFGVFPAGAQVVADPKTHFIIQACGFLVGFVAFLTGLITLIDLVMRPDDNPQDAH